MDEQALNTGYWVLAGITVLTLAHIAAGLWFRFSNRAEKRSVSFIRDAADSEEFKRHVEQNAREHAEIKRQMSRATEDIEREVKSDVKDLHEKINVVAMQGAANNKAQDMQTAHLVRIDAKLDRLTETLNRKASSSLP